MGLIKQALGSALGANDVKNGFNGPRIPFKGNDKSHLQQQQCHCSDKRQPARRSSSDFIDPSRGQYQNRSRSYSPCEKGHNRSVFRGQSSPNLDTPISSYGGPLQNQYVASYPDGPPSYDNVRDSHGQEGGYIRHSARSYDDQGLGRNHHQWNSLSEKRFRTLALPQSAYGDGQPFIRGYSEHLQQYGISKPTFIEILDAINVAIIPNPEMQIFQKGANIAGWFL